MKPREHARVRLLGLYVLPREVLCGVMVTLGAWCTTMRHDSSQNDPTKTPRRSQQQRLGWGAMVTCGGAHENQLGK